MGGELIIGVLGLALSVVTYFAGIRHAEKRHREDDAESRIEKVVDEYQRLFEPRCDSGIPALLKAGALLLRSEAEVREVCKRLELRNSTSPLRPFVQELQLGDLLPVLRALHDYKINPRESDCIAKAREAMLKGS